MLGLDQHPPLFVPRVRRILHLAKEPLLLLLRLEITLRLFPETLRQTQHPCVLGQPHEVTDLMPFAPTEHTPAAKTRIPTENDFDLRPRLPQPRHQKLQSRPSVPGRVNVGWPQIGHQQLFPAKHIERQETIITIVTVKETSLLLPMHPVIGRIKIQDQLRGRWRKRSDELIDDQLMHRPSHWAVGTVLQPAQRRTGGQRLVAFTAVCQTRS